MNWKKEIIAEMNRNRIIAIVVAVLVVVGGIVGYQYYKRTPTYTFKLIQTSIEKHDWDTFSRHVDTENMLSSAYDDLVENAMDDGDMDDSVKGFASGFIKMMKPGIVGALNDEIKQWVKTGNTKSETDADKKGKDAKKAADNIKKQANWEHSTLKGISYTKKEGDFSIVGVTIADQQLGRDFTLDIKMRQLDDGTWQVLEIANLKDYLKAAEEARKEKLAEINQPIQAEIDACVSLQPVKGQIVNGDAWGFSKHLRITAPAVFNSDKKISKVAGEISWKDHDGKVVSSPFELDAGMTKGNKNLIVSKDLNPFISGEAKLMKQGLSQYTFEMKLTKLSYEDGSTLELKKSLSDQ